MYNYIKHFGFLAFLQAELLPLSVSLVAVELFLQLGSFAAELGCFLVIWCILSYLGSISKKTLPSKKKT
ncbi:MAG: hypothetical protein SF052_22345 [Bacteroidia bacterium]|nr:hypothetical protein [Bacteroidia bacterium]